MEKIIVFIDSGDTLVEEKTEVYEGQTELVLSADLRPGAKELIERLKKRGNPVIMVADGLRQSFINVHTQHGIYDLYDGHIYSEDVGVHKPDKRMFQAALDVCNLTENDVKKIIMVGNNLSRDVKGANEMGITSVFMSWTDRYPKEPVDQSEKPDYTIVEPLELLDLIDKLEKSL
ncbi:HAD family hydrolase [Acidaminobacter sp. JC074]|uniref:HAD family hydrolase n=1 Tax=Acidaminobacter sp. JC074 TaxID=2530199 RepID=UPI001F0ED174